MVTPKAKPIDVALVEDDPGVRRSLTAILQRDAACRCVGSYASPSEALLEIPRLQPGVVLMDVNLPGMDGVECVRRLRELAPGSRIVMLTVHNEPDIIFNSLAAGASGYLLKPVRSADLLAAVLDVYGGGAPMTSNIARKVVESFQRTETRQRESDDLSPRELAVLGELAKGYSYKEAAEILGISYSTVRTHIEHIYQKLHVHSCVQAVARYLEA
jgi:DNA-binding NarL/FixJ family response regulator